MKFKIIIFALILGLAGCAKENINFPTTDCYWSDMSSGHFKNQEYQTLLNNAVSNGLPGISMLISKAGEDLWIGSAGVSIIEKQQVLEPCNIMPAGGGSMLFCGAAVMLMVEDGLLNLDVTIDKYLGDDLSSQVPNAHSATIAHLLSHTSGIPDYADNIFGRLDLLNHKDMDFSRETMLEEYVYGKRPKFTSGLEYSYSNSNYEILTLIMDKVYPEGHEAFYAYRLFSRLGLRKTYYKEDTTNVSLYAKGMANGYFDRHSDGRLENATDLSLTIATGQTGSGGIFTNVVDLHNILKSIMEAQLVSQESLDLMKEYIKEEEGFLTYKYGLGLVYSDYGEYGMAIGHSGSLPGFSTEAWYFPDSDVYIIYMINAGNFYSGPIQKLIDKTFWDAVLTEVF